MRGLCSSAKLPTPSPSLPRHVDSVFALLCVAELSSPPSAANSEKQSPMNQQNSPQTQAAQAGLQAGMQAPPPTPASQQQASQPPPPAQAPAAPPVQIYGHESR